MWLAVMAQANFTLDEDTEVLVIDNGSSSCKAGLAGEDMPTVDFPSMIGKPRHEVRPRGVTRCAVTPGAVKGGRS